MLGPLGRFLKFPFFVRLLLVLLVLQLTFYFSTRKYALKTRMKSVAQTQTHILNKTMVIPALASEGSWQTVVPENSQHKYLVFSAFLDVRNGRSIRIIAVTKTSTRKKGLVKPWCKLWYETPESGLNSKLVEGELKIIQEHWQLPYSPYYVTCPLSENESIPLMVSLLNDPAEEPLNMLKVISNYPEGKKWDANELEPDVKKMAVCVKPLHYDYNKELEFLEFIELHRIMGADHFILYNHTVGPQVNCLLKKYQQQGIVTVLPWELPIQSQKDIRTEGIFASLNDCLFRTMYKFSHVIFLDFDEFIIPTNHYNYRELFRYLHEKYNNKKTSWFSFKNAFFYRQWPDDPAVQEFEDPLEKQLLALRKTTRMVKLHAHGTRSKLIVRPDLVDMVGNHIIWAYYNHKVFRKMDVAPEDAILHHYRICEFGGNDCVKHPSTVDRSAYRYRDALLKAVKTRHEDHFDECQLSKIEGSKYPS
ncbi:glycosyltransferase family 92 protein F13G3.3 [Dendroctonus ponderosae]|uniref:Glycosyltransferase family 92 protein n=2 Tax=Dendroctonus ponderosae TaxID=77166 RepID=A0AAR5Q793_DENPD|nr:glycosyltransferase family 92 protein F13G3.3 [Dendroctonus ponderosae]